MAAKQHAEPLLNQVSAEDNNKNKWVSVKSLKRRNGSPKENKVIKKRQLNIDYWLAGTTKPIPTKNSFEILKNATENVGENAKNNSSTATTSIKIATKVPPIFVSGVQNIKPLRDTLDKIAGTKYTLKLVDNEEIKILSENSEIYNLIVNELDKKNTLFYTFQKKENKPYKVVLKSMHPSVDINELKSEIESHGHIVVGITNAKHKLTKQPLPIFFVEIKANIENNKKIFEITRLMNQIISFEQPRKKREVTQCMRCQDYGHTKNYCRKIPVCVKCA